MKPNNHVDSKTKQTSRVKALHNTARTATPSHHPTSFSMTVSEKLVELVVQIYWAFATACTTDISSKTRDWMIQRFNFEYFRTAKQHRDLLVQLEQPGIVDQLDESDVMSNEFKRWLNGCYFNDIKLLPQHMRLVGDLVKLDAYYHTRINKNEELARLSGLLQQVPAVPNKKQKKQLGPDPAAKQYLLNSKEYVALVIKMVLDQAHVLTKYQNDYESVLLQITGKARRQVAKPSWADLEVGVRMTVVNLAHQAGNHDGQQSSNCFDHAVQQFAHRTQPAQPAQLAQLAQPAQTAQLAQPAQLAQTADSGRPADLDEPVTPTKVQHGASDSESSELFA